jgi:phage FluMu protein Com
MEKWRYAAKILVLLGAVSLVASIVAFLQGTTSSAANPYAPPFPTIPALLFVLFMVLTLSSIVVRATAGKSIAEAWLAISSAIRDQCPLCKKLNARQLVGGELTKQYDDQGTVVDKAVAEATHRVPSKDAKTGHEFNYRCRFCHSSWTVPTRSSAENRTQR